MNICGVVDLLYPSKFNWLLMAPKSFPGGVVVKNPPVNAGDTRNVDSIPLLVRTPEVENVNPFQYFCQENSMDRGAWLFTVGLNCVAEHTHTCTWLLKWETLIMPNMSYGNSKKIKFKKSQCVCLVAQLCLTVCDPMDCSLSGSKIVFWKHYLQIWNNGKILG